MITVNFSVKMWCDLCSMETLCDRSVINRIGFFSFETFLLVLWKIKIKLFMFIITAFI